MQSFKAFIKKEFKHIFRDKRTLLILFGIPVAQVLLFGFVIKNEIKNVNIAIHDKSNDFVTKEIKSKILSSGFFQLYENIENSQDYERLFESGMIREIIVFEPKFAEKLHKENKADMLIIADASDANSANLMSNYTSAIVFDYIKKLNTNVEIPFQINVEERMLFNEQMKDVYMFVPGIMAMILMLVSAMMTSISVAGEKEMGTMEVLLVSPLKPVQILIGKVTPYFVLSFVNALVIIYISVFVFGMPIVGNIFLLFAETMLFIFLALSLGILISTAAPSRQVAMFVSMFALMLPTILLSGFIFPIENMPVILQYLAHIMPPKYFIIILKNIMLKGAGFEFIWKETLILCGMTLFFILMSAKKFKLRLE